MTVQLPVAVVIAQWAVLLGLGFLVLVLYRQLAFLMDLKDRRHSLEEQTGGLADGAPVPSFDYQVYEGDGQRVESWLSGARGATVMLFGDPLCASCERALLALESLAKSGRLRGVDCLVVTSESPEIVAAVDAFRDSILPIAHVQKEVIVQAFNLKATPYLLFADAVGAVAASGPVHDEKTILQLLQHVTGSRTEALPFVPMSRSRESV
jgi:hypothetical protein